MASIRLRSSGVNVTSSAPRFPSRCSRVRGPMIGAVIPGWVEALQLMKVGDKWQLFIPAKLAYGEQSPTPAIPPNSVLIFEVELLGIEK